MNYIGEINIDFPISLFHLDLNTVLISKEILSQKPIRLSDNPSHTFYEDYKFNPLPNSESENFVKLINKYYGDRYNLVNIWSHIHKPLESTNTHTHIPSNLSFVYYIKVPKNSGKFVIDFTFINGPRIPISPVEGNLILFPSWLPHMVTKNLSKDIRISISGNLNIKK